MIDCKSLSEKLGVQFKNIQYLLQAVTHRSYLNENPHFDVGHNERLEFLGDAVLELVVTEYLYDLYPEKPEGELTSLRAALVNSEMLACVGGEIHISEFLLLSRGEKKDTGRARQYILANAFEAIIGAIYLDQGYDVTKMFIHRVLMPHLADVIEKKLWKDPKSMFQEEAQERAGITPSYRVMKEIGPDHQKKFSVGVYLGSTLIAEGIGLSKQEAEVEAARRALEVKRWT